MEKHYLTLQLVFMVIFSMTPGFSQDILAGHTQAIVVTTADWTNIQGNAQLFERQDDTSPWKLVKEAIPVVVGRAGLAWGIGLHPFQNLPALKREGDEKAPAGIFSIGSAFGLAPSHEMTHLRIEYFTLTRTLETVDDPTSRYYNRIIDTNEINPDWNSSEKMGFIPCYKIGFVINHNFPHPEPYAGSAIFFHLWHDSHLGTEGCTATSYEHLSTILSWLERTKNPVLVQLPLPTYQELRSTWHLP